MILSLSTVTPKSEGLLLPFYVDPLMTVSLIQPYQIYLGLELGQSMVCSILYA